ncbi:MAG: bifunctional aspartate kinase/homoserine dehydrogenase I [Bacteriovoracaceae bacterium]|jgi:bifunctional aspartokinase / homoserine dehydrogenase 1|nr:bifunctional aspartate kinase/homoserine dehydrogenase I [Bacteriovoracaceae bacterium]
MELEVHKFGGTSLNDSKCIQRVASIFEDLNTPKKRIILILSAVGGVTNSLIESLKLAAVQDKKYEHVLKEIIDRHQKIITELFSDKSQIEKMGQILLKDFEDLKDILRSVWLGKAYSELNMELVSGYGEQWSTLIMTALLQLKVKNINRIDARDILVVEHYLTGPDVNWKKSKANAKPLMSGNDSLVVTGYIASTPKGVPTTLKRNGSDYSASIFGALLNASSIHIWSDVEGVMSADPRRVKEAKVLNSLSFKEALELAYFGAKVLHPKTMVPAMKKGIPLWIRSTFNKENKGTKIEGHINSKPDPNSGVVKGFATIDDIAVINLEGAGMIGVPGIAENLFGTLRRAGISVIMISQASSEYSISLAVKNEDGIAAKNIIEETFARELSQSHMKGVKLISDCCILAAVGDNMAHTEGVSGSFFGALARAHVNIRMIAQGSSERNISVVIDKVNVDRALNVVHSAFYLSHQTISVGLVGVGLIGGTLMKQIKSQKDILMEQFDIDLRVRGICDSKKMLLGGPCSLNELDLSKKGEELEWEKFCQHIKPDHIPHAVIIDCTASSKIGELYPQWLAAGIHIVTPNKKANSEGMDLYNELREIIGLNGDGKRLKKNIQYFYETTVGAGLPIISTLKDLLKTGDKILKIEGVFSGTLSYIFNEYKSGMKFSDVVFKAKEKGYTEPDPRDDLSGMDVARKAIILGRESGLSVDVKDVPIKSLVPDILAGENVDVIEYLNKLPDYDEEMTALLEKALANDSVLRFVGTVDMERGISVGLGEFKKDHAFAQLNGSENIVQFTTKRYKDFPLIIRGPGAGAEVTAAGVFSDLLRLAELLRTNL